MKIPSLSKESPKNGYPRVKEVVPMVTEPVTSLAPQTATGTLPPWSTDIDCPATVAVSVRGVPLGLGFTDRLTKPLINPPSPPITTVSVIDITLIALALPASTVAVQLKQLLLDAITLTDTVPPAAAAA